MFHELWFWLMLASVVSIMVLLEKANKMNYVSCQSIGSLCSAGVVVFAILGIFFANKWWYGIVGLLISVALSSIISSMLSKKLALLSAVGSLCLFLAPAFTLATYIVWY